MSTAAKIRAGGAVVEISTDQRPLDRDLNALQRKLAGAAARISTVGKSLALAGFGGATALALPTKFALDAVAQARKFQAVFGSQSKAANDFANTLATAMNRGAADIKSQLSTYQAFFRGLGFGAEQARKMSQAVTKIGADFGAFFGVGDEEVRSRFISALSGSSEVLDQFGINIKQAAIDQELLRLGIRKTAAQAEESEKVLARINVIQRSLQNQGAQGISLRSSGDADQKISQLASRAKELGVTLGTELIPSVAAVADRATKLVRSANDFAAANPRLVSGVAALATYGSLSAIAIGLTAGATARLVGAAGLAIPVLRGTARAAALSRDAFLALKAAESGAFVFGRVARYRDTIVSAGGAANLLSARLLPVGLLAGKFVLIAAAVAAVTYGIYKLTDATATLSYTATDASKELKSAFSGDNALIDRLKSLANAQNTTSETGREAERIARTLETRYGSLGITVNRATGQVNGLAAALDRVAKAQERQSNTALSKELAEAQANLAALRKESDAYGGTLTGIGGIAKDVGRTVVGSGPLWGGDSSVVAGARSVGNRIEKEAARVAELRRLLRGETVATDSVTAINSPIAQRVDAEADLNAELLRLYQERRRERMSETEKEIDHFKQSAARVMSVLHGLASGELSQNGATDRYFALLREAGEVEADTARRIARVVADAEQQNRDDRKRTIREAIGDADELQKQAERNAAAMRDAISGALSIESTGNPLIDAAAFLATATHELDRLKIVDPDQLAKLKSAIEAIRAEIAAGGIDAAKSFSAAMRQAERDRQDAQRRDFAEGLARKLADLNGDEELTAKLDAEAFRRDAQAALAELSFLNPTEIGDLQGIIDSIAAQIGSGAQRAVKEFSVQFAEAQTIAAARRGDMQRRIASQIGGRQQRRDWGKPNNDLLADLKTLLAKLSQNIGVTD